ncbi:chloroplastic/chromoplastic [Seminavis robusta]|uniref:Chloroplastic/chromoplastic n=1 Tax=Seminavis robusta TaxID=568900 RepID=A0A9N8HTN8_9STRA|nr:chloroplastic/chromoplastic [Seminavis robusta]|eukprot:Sro1688_g291260.1 chloroplastic/chromoplastic (747) ;mRNA; r:15516-17756
MVSCSRRLEKAALVLLLSSCIALECLEAFSPLAAVPSRAFTGNAFVLSPFNDFVSPSDASPRSSVSRLYASKKKKKKNRKSGEDSSGNDDGKPVKASGKREAPEEKKKDTVSSASGPPPNDVKSKKKEPEDKQAKPTTSQDEKVPSESTKSKEEASEESELGVTVEGSKQTESTIKDGDDPSEEPTTKEDSSEVDSSMPPDTSSSIPDDVNTDSSTDEPSTATNPSKKKRVVVIGAGWGGLSTAHALAKEENVQVTLVEASPRVGGLVRDGFTTTSGARPAEAGQHGFWNNYHNIYRLLQNEIPGITLETALTDYAEQGQYSPDGLEAVWPIYRDQPITLPTGLAQAAFTKFLKLPLLDRITAFPLVLAFSEFDDSPEAWEKYDQISFRDLCVKLGVSKRCYDEAFEPMILTGLFAPGGECSAAAALGMAYFFVLQSQTAFDVQWCRGNIGDVIFTPWVKDLQDKGVEIKTSTQVTGFAIDDKTQQISHVKVKDNGDASTIDADDVVLAVGAKALNNFVQYCPELAQFPDLARFANLRGTSVLATRVFLDKDVKIPYTANACWGFDAAIGMTVFDIKGLHGDSASTVAGAPGAVIEVDYYHANKLLVLSDDEIVAKVKRDLDRILVDSRGASVVDAAVVRLPQGVNWYFPGSYQDMPDTRSSAISNLYFAGDIVRSRHGSWSQEKAFVTGIEAANAILGKPPKANILPVAADELHVQLGKKIVNLSKSLLGRGDPWKAPSLVDFFW